MSSPEARYDAEERRALLEVARVSVENGLRAGRPAAVDPERHPDRLRTPGASFVTLRRRGALRGCLGSLQASRPLIADVAQNAFGAAFRDPRFPPLNRPELEGLAIHISVLSPPERLGVTSEHELVQKLRPGVDGLVLREGPFQGTLLPAVWGSIPDAESFVREVKRKAGLPIDYWSPDLEAYRYTTESFC